MEAYRVIKHPHISEKGHDYSADLNTYVFTVDTSATKDDIRVALKEIWGVSPISVRTLMTNPKRRRRGTKIGFTNSVKKAYVRLPEGQSISVLK